MVEYSKDWLSVEQQVERLKEHHLQIPDEDHAAKVLAAIGYYRLTGYLYPFRMSEEYVDEEGRTRVRVFSDFRPGTQLSHAEAIIDFDRRLRMLVLDGLERIEVAVRMRIGYVLGRASAFAYEDPTRFIGTFTADGTDIRDPKPSKHVQWLQRVSARQAGSDEKFVEHFREKYDDRMPVWALTEILELGHLVAALFTDFPTSDVLTIESLGAPQDWGSLARTSLKTFVAPEASHVGHASQPYSRPITIVSGDGAG